MLVVALGQVAKGLLLALSRQTPDGRWCTGERPGGVDRLNPPFLIHGAFNSNSSLFRKIATANEDLTVNCPFIDPTLPQVSYLSAC